MRLASALLAMTVSLLVPAGLASPAHADSKVIRDGAEALPASMDLLTVGIDNGPRAVVLTLQFRGLREGGRANARVLVNPRPRDSVAYIAFAKLTRSGQTVANLQVSTDDEFGGRPITCQGLRARWQVGAGRLRVVVPQRCLDVNGDAAQFKAVSGFWGGGQTGDYTRFVNVARG